jgi:hypothetical protein
MNVSFKYGVILTYASGLSGTARTSIPLSPRWNQFYHSITISAGRSLIASGAGNGFLMMVHHMVPFLHSWTTFELPC